VNYPVACSPQAWAAAAPFGLLASCLGLEISTRRREVRLNNPVMPARLNSVRLTNLRLGSSSVDLQIERHGAGAAVGVLRKEGEVSVLVQS
jgi:glycogen debranching enzyme